MMKGILFKKEIRAETTITPGGLVWLIIKLMSLINKSFKKAHIEKNR